MAGSKGRTAVDPIEVMEAAYDLEVDDRAWLTQLITAVRPLLDGGRGISGYTFDIAIPMTSWLDHQVAIDLSPDYLIEQRAFQLEASGGTAEAMHVVPEPLDALVEAARKAGFGNILDNPVHAEHWRKMKVRDYVAFLTVEPGGKGVCVNAGQQDVRTFDARTKQLWARVAAHVAAGRRLRTAARDDAARAGSPSGASIEHGAEAVLTPAGKLEHVAGEHVTATAQAALREAVSRQETARGKLRRQDPERATEAWTALVSGRWSLVDRYERGGKRYIVARPNELAVPDPRALTQRERTVVNLAVLGKTNKLIAYELGLSASTVATHLSTAMRKLGVETRVELIQLARELGAR